MKLGGITELQIGPWVLKASDLTSGQYLMVSGSGISSVPMVSGPPAVSGNVAYATGPMTVPSGSYQLHVRRLSLTTTQRLILAGDARLRIA